MSGFWQRILKYRWWLVSALATLFFLFAGYELSILPEAVANKCSPPNEGYKYYCPGYIVAGAFLDAVAGFLKPYSDVLTAISGIAVAAFTFTLWLTTRQMWRTSIDQIAVAQKSANAAIKSVSLAENLSFRPLVRVRNVHIFPYTPEGRIDFKKGDVLEGRIYVMNIGSTKADIQDNSGRIIWGKRPLPMVAPRLGEKREVIKRGTILERGDLLEVVCKAEDIAPVDASEVETSEWRPYFWGYINYRDQSGAVRRTAFCRELSDGRFIPVKADKDYEYED